MNISEVNVRLSGNDILSIINEFVKVDGLTLKSMIINDDITLEGSFKKVVTVNFRISVEFVKCEGNKIHARISKVVIFNIGIFRMIRSFVLKNLSKSFKEKWIDSEKDKVIIDVQKIINDVPFVDLKVDDVVIENNEVCARVKEINVSLSGGLKKEEEKEAEPTEEELKLEELNKIKKLEDNYSKGREKLMDKLPEKVDPFKEYLFVLPDIVSLIYRLLKDSRVPMKTKLIISGTIAYIAFPTDIIPDNIPFIGKIDDIGVLFFALNKIVNDVPIEIIVENWTGRNDILLVLKKGVDYLTNFTGAKNVEKIYSVVEGLSTL